MILEKGWVSTYKHLIKLKIKNSDIPTEIQYWQIRYQYSKEKDKILIRREIWLRNAMAVSVRSKDEFYLGRLYK